MRFGQTMAAIGIAVSAWLSTPSAGAIITGETATATSELSGFGRLAIRAVDNLGISTTTGTPNLATDGDFLHNSVDSHMWMGGTPGAPGDALNESITIDFQNVYAITGMRLWNYNETNGGDTGIQIYDLETSLNGSTWTLQQDDQSLAQAPGAAGYAGVYTAVNWSDVRFVRITIRDTYRATDDAAGLAEAMFTGEVPEPSCLGLVAGAGALMFRGKRRRA